MPSPRSTTVLALFVVVATASASSVVNVDSKSACSCSAALASSSIKRPFHVIRVSGLSTRTDTNGAFLTHRYFERVGFASPAPSSPSNYGGTCSKHQGARTPSMPPHFAEAVATGCDDRRFFYGRNPNPSLRDVAHPSAASPIHSAVLGLSPSGRDIGGGDDDGDEAGAITNYDDVLVSDTPPSERGIGVGVDLGTTNSAVAVLAGDGGRPTIIPIPNFHDSDSNSDGPSSSISPPQRRTVPSVVCFAGGGSGERVDEEGRGADVLVGEEAVRREHVYPRSTFRNVKRIIGTGGRIAARNAPLVPNFAALQGEDPLSSKRTGSKSKRKKGRKGRKRKSKSEDDDLNPLEVPLSQQLRDAWECPAMLSLSIPNREEHGGDGAKGTDNDEQGQGSSADELLVAPEEVSSHVLRRLFRAAEAYTNETVTRAVVGVPAYFNDAQREATERACRLAGVGKVRLIREPEAAALAYGLGRERQKRAGLNGRGGSTEDGDGEFDDDDELVLVFDLGGGTFDVSVLRVGGGLMEVVASGGNAMLGGSDFDRSIAQHIQKQIVASAEGGGSKVSSKEVFRNPAVLDALLRSAEAVRVYLSNHRRATLAVPSTEEGWLGIARASDVVVPPNDVAALREAMKASITAEEEADLVLEDDERPICNETHIVFDLSRAEMEELCGDQLIELLRPVREVAILAGALLPGDARPSLVEAAFAMEEGHPSSVTGGFEEFYEEDGGRGEAMLDGVGADGSPVKNDGDEAAFDADALLQIRNMDVKAMRREQQRGRKRARSLATRERKFRQETRKADQKAKGVSGVGRSRGSSGPSSSVGGTVKVQDSIGGRPLSQVVLVGGATKMPAIGRILSALTGVVPRKTVNPDEAVALGCAIQVGILDGDKVLSEMQVLSPIQAAVLRAVARKRGLDMVE